MGFGGHAPDPTIGPAEPPGNAPNTPAGKPIIPAPLPPPGSAPISQPHQAPRHPRAHKPKKPRKPRAPHHSSGHGSHHAPRHSPSTHHSGGHVRHTSSGHAHQPRGHAPRAPKTVGEYDAVGKTSVWHYHHATHSSAHRLSAAVPHRSPR